MPFLRFGSRLRATVPCLIVTLAAACGDDPPPATPTSTKVQSESSVGCGNTGATSGFLAAQTIKADGNPRTYDVFVPPDGAGGKTPLPLIFVFHSAGGTGADIRKSYDLEGAVQGKAIFAYPDAQSGDWNLDSKADKNNDMLMFDAILDALSTSHCIDRQRVFATGYSSGAYFSNQLGCRRGNALRAIAAHAGGGPNGDNDEYNDQGALKCPERAVAALISHGTADTEVKLSEGQKSRDYWRTVNGCKSGNGDPVDPSPCTQLAGCADHRAVAYCEIPGLGHEVWSSGPQATWAFFSSL